MILQNSFNFELHFTDIPIGGNLSYNEIEFYLYLYIFILNFSYNTSNYKKRKYILNSSYEIEFNLVARTHKQNMATV